MNKLTKYKKYLNKNSLKIEFESPLPKMRKNQHSTWTISGSLTELMNDQKEFGTKSKRFYKTRFTCDSNSKVSILIFCPH